MLLQYPAAVGPAPRGHFFSFLPAHKNETHNEPGYYSKE